MAVLLLNVAPRCRSSAQGRVMTARTRLTNSNKEAEMKALFNRFVQEESGQDLIEYGLLIGIITTGAIAAIGAIGPKVGSYYSSLNAALP